MFFKIFFIYSLTRFLTPYLINAAHFTRRFSFFAIKIVFYNTNFYLGYSSARYMIIIYWIEIHYYQIVIVIIICIVIIIIMYCCNTCVDV